MAPGRALSSLNNDTNRGRVHVFASRYRSAMPRSEPNRVFPSQEVAFRIERAEGRLVAEGSQAAARREPEGGAFAIDVAGGVAAFGGPGSPLNKVSGLGFGGLPTDAEWRAVERRYAQRNVGVQVEVSTLADPAVATFLTGRGYSLVGFENVVGRALLKEPSPEPSLVPCVTVQESAQEDLDSWIDVVVSGFAVPDEQGVTSDEEFPRKVIATAMRDLAQVVGFVRYLARLDGVVAGGASARFTEGVAQLNGAATLSGHRRRGVQSALLAARLLAGRALGCDLAVATTQPGSKSQQNLHRLGFDLLYARAVLVRNESR